MLILLPPSEGKTAPRRGNTLDTGRLSFPELMRARFEVLGALVALCTTEGLPLESAAARHVAAATLGLGPTQSEEVDKNAKLLSAPTARADRVYSGVLYEALDLASLDSAAKRRATRRIAIFSGLFGALRPSDPIPSYRLSAGVSLPGIGPVASYWKQHLDNALGAAAGDGLVVDLRSSQYEGFWKPAPDLRVCSVRVLHEQGGRRKVVSHFNKATKGRIVRALLEDGGAPSTVEAFLTQLRDLGWQAECTRPGLLDVVVHEV